MAQNQLSFCFALLAIGFATLNGARCQSDEQSQREVDPETAAEVAVAVQVDAELKHQPIPSLEELTTNNLTFLRLLSGYYYQRTYDRINSYLVDHEESLDVSKNMKIAANWLQELSSEPKNPLNWNLIDALEQFLALTQIGGEKRCNRYSYSILFKNDQATYKRVRSRREKLSPKKRIEHLVHQYGLSHSIDCLYVYPRTYEEIHSKMDPLKVHYAETFISTIVQSITNSKAGVFFGKKSSDVIGNTVIDATRLRSIRSKDVGFLALDLLKSFAIDDPDLKYLGLVTDEKKGKLVVDKVGISKLVEKYFVESCEYYIQELGPDVYVPMFYDLRLLDLDDRYDSTDSDLQDFLTGSYHFKLCNSFVRDDVGYLVEEIASVVKKHSMP